MNSPDSSLFQMIESWWRGIIVLLDRNGAITHLNEKGSAILSCSFDNVEGKLWIDTFIPENERDRVRSVFNKFMDGDFVPNSMVEGEVITCRGTRRNIRWYNTPLKDDDGKITGTMSYGEDITEEKQVQDCLRKMQQFQESVIANANIWIAVLSPDSTILVWNEAAETISGYKKRDVLGKKTVWKQLYPEKDYRMNVTREIQRIIGQDRYLENFETEIHCADRTKKIIVWNTRGLRDNTCTITGFIAIGRDITAQKTAEIRAAESSRFLAIVIDALPTPIFFKDISGKYLGCNTPFEEYIGMKRDQLIGRTVYDISPKDLAEKYTASDRKVLENSIPERYETQMQYADDSRHDVIFYKAPFFDKDGSVKGLIGTFLDITERKRMESELRDSQQILEGILNTIPARVFWKDKNLRYLGCNTPFARDAGFEKPGDIIGKDDFSMGWRDQAEIYRADDRAVIESGRAKLMVEEPQTTPAGETLYLLTNKLPLLDDRGDAIGVLGTYLDITERKRGETAIHESQQLFADIISFLPDPTFVIDKEGKVLAWNRALEQLSSVTAEEMIGQGDYEYSIWQYGKRRPILIDLVLHPDQDAGRQNYSHINVDGHTVTAQTEIIRMESGHTASLLLVASPLIDAQGKITGAIESIRDISRLKETEAELSRINQNLEKIVSDRTRALEDQVAQRVHAENDVKDALKYTRSVIEANPDLVAVIDGKGTIMDVNAAAESLTGVPREKMIGTPYFSYLVDDGTLNNVLSRLLEKGRIETYVHIRRTDRHITPLSINATLISGIGETDPRIIVAGHDITRQKHDEDSIKASLNEKVLLLREVHHRVKNNLQIIISLVNLQNRRTANPEVKQILSETQNRVRAMSLVHEKLYRSDSLSAIDFADYTRFLATQLFSSFSMDTRRVRLDFAMDKIMVDINTAIPLGLLMNELISNSLKHAFPDGRKGAISISSRYEGDLITLVVKDNGIGIPKELDWKSTTSLGMLLVTSLVDQVDGTVTLDRENGTMFTLKVKRGSHQEKTDDGIIQAN